MKHNFSVLLAVIVMTAIFCVPSNAKAETIPTISIVSVVKDDSVTIETANYPVNVDFDVRMGKIGTRGVNGFLVDTVNSGTGGKQTYTFDIPADLLGLAQISIRLESTLGFFSYNWFSNNTAAATPATTATPAPTSTPAPGATVTTTPKVVIPTFSITSVTQDESVSIETLNFPANMKFDVLMGKIGTRGVGGVLVTTIDSGAGGTLDATFDIPESLAGLQQISIRLESSTGYFSYNWFWNNSNQ